VGTSDLTRLSPLAKILFLVFKLDCVSAVSTCHLLKCKRSEGNHLAATFAAILSSPDASTTNKFEYFWRSSGVPGQKGVTDNSFDS
jgi:hypothetical protein